MDNPTNEYPEPRTDYIEARKVSMVTLEAKEVPLAKVEQPTVSETGEEEISHEKDYIPTSNLLDVRNVAYSTREDTNVPPKEEEAMEEGKPPENKEHRLFYGAVMGGKGEIDRTMEEKTISKQC